MQKSVKSFRSSSNVEPRVQSGVPRGVLVRIGLLSLVLVVTKVLLLWSYRRHLFEVYWYPQLEPVGASHYIFFALFVIVSGGVLWTAARSVETSALPVIRRANLILLTLASFFIFASFHEGDTNYLVPWMNGCLRGSDYWSYLSLNFFFRSPFLGAWVMAYAAAYYVMWRKGRERYVVRATAIFALSYVALCLQDLAVYAQELLIATAVGCAVIVAPRKLPGHYSRLWLFLPVVLVGLVYWSWRSLSDLMIQVQPETLVLSGSVMVLFGGAMVVAWRHGFMRYWIGLFLFGFVVFILLANTNYPTSPHYRILIGYAFTLSRYFLGEILVATGLLLAVVLYNRWRRQVTWVWLDIVCVALMLIALLDLRVSQVMSTRLDWDLLALAWGEGPKMMWQMAKPYLPMVMGAIGLISLVYFGTVRFLDRSASLQRSESAVLNMRFGLVLALLLSLVGRYVVGVDKATGPAIEVLARSSPLFRGVTDSSFPESEFRETAVRLGVIPSASTASSDSKNAPAPRDWNVVFVLLESTSNEHLSLFSGTRETQPLLSQYVNRMELFPNFFSSFAGSINARFACFAGLYPVRGFEQFTRRRVAVPSLFETLSDHGWATSVFYSSHFDYTNFRDFLRARKIDEMYDADTMPGERTTQPVSWGLREEETLAAMQHQIRKYAAAQKKFFLTYIPAAPHYPYDGVPERFRKFRSTEYRNFTAQYLNELLYMDWVITSLIDELKSNHLLDRTMIVITGDHGEMLGGEGSAVGHGWAITPQLANVPLIIMDPTIKSRTVNPTIGSQVDLLPTILSRLNLPVPFGQLYQGLSLDSLEAKQDRTIYLNSFSQFGVLRGHQMVCGERGNDRLKHFYEITNDGSRTQFASSPEVLFPMPSIAEFDRFQENFLRNYAGYAREHAEKVGRLAMRDESGSP